MQIYVACAPSSMSIAMAYFSYGANNENGTADPTLWMAANAYANTTPPLTQGNTVKSGAPAYYYIQNTYSSCMSIMQR
jgi:hypothetical protein